MAKSKKYNDIKKYYDMKFWTIAMVANAVKKGWITPEEYEEITGEDYE